MKNIWEGLSKEWIEFLPSGWREEIWAQDLNKFILSQVNNKIDISPQYKDIWRAFNLVSPKDVKVLILGQDPYPNPMQADGLAFSSKNQDKLPGTLKNIFKELKNDLNIDRQNGDLTNWAKQGVLLLNVILTTKKGISFAHKKKGWEIFNEYILKSLNDKKKSGEIVFVFWGKQSQSKINLITNPEHYIIKGVHPSPNSCFMGYFGENYFSNINQILKANKQKIIDWSL